ncbi:MAG: hypothetical protein K9W45_07660 [Candidatus Heimdallarchaeum aukensis]|uniref:Uncharacterized protein n=1 Tax=Candidatus Heimdallarchaeum aukensis TaxID=2876573 RepID=A0A9Y1BIH9_9ARCH|nr:MAG: hypothetical protein K9W45_07660 [Candidatus Heimdallarchaeum aukensis]
MSDVENKLVELVNSINTLAESVNAIQNTISHFSEQLSNFEKQIAGFNLNELNAKVDDIKTKIETFSLVSDKLANGSLENLQYLTDIPSIRNILGILETKIEQLTANLDKKLVEVASKQEISKKIEPKPVPSEPTPATTLSSSEVLNNDFEIKEHAPQKETSTEYTSPGIAEEPVISTAAADAQVAMDAIKNKFKHISQMISPQSISSSVLKYLEELRDEVETSVGMSPMLYEINSWLKKIDKLKADAPLHPDLHKELAEKLVDWQERVLSAIKRKYE